MAIQESPITRASLLVRLRDRTDHGAWNEFVSLYGPVIYGFARNRGLQDADAADTMQDVLRSVLGAVERLDYDPSQGTFRGWLFTITRNKVFNHFAGRRGRALAAGGSDAHAQLSQQADGQSGLEDAWEQDYRKQVAAAVMQQIRPDFQPGTWQAFWRTAVLGEPAAEVAAALEMSPGAVYVARSRVLARVRDEVQRRLDEEVR